MPTKRNSHSRAAKWMAYALILALIMPLTVQATDFITDVMVIGNNDKTDFDNMQQSYVAEGWIAINKDLNAGCGGESDYIHLLYKTTASKGSSGTPITDFYITTGENPKASLEYYDRTYYLVPCVGSSSFVNSQGDLNRGCGSNSDYIYLYYTKDIISGHLAVTDIAFDNIQSGALGKDGEEEGYDLNAGCGQGTPYIYMHFTTENITGANVVMLTSASTDVELQDGDVLAGRADNKPHVTIPDGATVTLSGAEVYVNLSSDQEWPSITCLGDAVIILDEDLTTKLLGGRTSGIYVPEGKTLTIRGNGTLETTGRGTGAGIGGGGNIVIESGTVIANGGEGGAGIGTNCDGNCATITISGGNVTATGGAGGAGIGTGRRGTCDGIVIEGGTVKAQGGSKAAGIGTGETDDISIMSLCKSVTISGGNVTAKGGNAGAGIGSGKGYQNGQLFGYSLSQCGPIVIEGGTVTATGGNAAAGIGTCITLCACTGVTITNGVTSVTAIKGNNSNAIGNGSNDYITCGPVTIGGIETGTIADSPFTTFPYTVSFDSNGGTGSMANTSFMYDVTHKLPANSFTHSKGYSFIGWATSPNGAVVYDDEQSVKNLADTYGAPVKLYAKWNVTTLASGSGDIGLSHGSILTGTGGSNTHVTIADGATVTLRGVNITAITQDRSHQWPGISCLGDAVIILEDGTTNDVKGGYYCSGIYVAEGKTLTIKGGGTLNATAGYWGTGIGSSFQETCGNIVIEGGTINAIGDAGAGIGGGFRSSCGDITISGGFVTATGGGAGAGIGSYDGSCGNITISGGSVTATGDDNAAGIGSGPNNDSSCGDITITNGVTSVTATRGRTNIQNSSDADIIGAGIDGICGTISISNELTDVTSDDGMTRSLYHTLTLANDANNTTTISSKNGKICQTATLSGRTLYKDGDWNTLCLPFDVTDFNGTPLAGATVKTLETTSFSDGTLTLNFTEDANNLTAIEAGTPYIVKWDKPTGYDGHESDYDISNPVFTCVTVKSNSAGSAATEWVDFVGTYSPEVIYESSSDKTKLYLGSSSALYHPLDEGFAVNACRAYFQLKGLTAGTPASSARAFVLNFGDGDATSIAASPYPSPEGKGTTSPLLQEGTGEAIDLTGRRIDGIPTAKGVYIVNGKKIIIK